MTLYFDPTRRPVQLAPVVAAPRPGARTAPAGYFDPDKPRVVRSPFPSAAELAALVAAVAPLIDGLSEDTAESLAWRRAAFLRRCEWCGAPAGGEFGHRPQCRLHLEQRLKVDKWWLNRRARVSQGEGKWSEPDDDDDELPF